MNIVDQHSRQHPSPHNPLSLLRAFCHSCMPLASSQSSSSHHTQTLLLNITFPAPPEASPPTGLRISSTSNRPHEQHGRHRTTWKMTNITTGRRHRYIKKHMLQTPVACEGAAAINHVGVEGAPQLQHLWSLHKRTKITRPAPKSHCDG